MEHYICHICGKDIESEPIVILRRNEWLRFCSDGCFTAYTLEPAPDFRKLEALYREAMREELRGVRLVPAGWTDEPSEIIVEDEWPDEIDA